MTDSVPDGPGLGIILNEEAIKKQLREPGYFEPTPQWDRIPAPIQLAPTCYHGQVDNRTEPKTLGQWVRYVVVAIIALFLVWWMLRVYVL